MATDHIADVTTVIHAPIDRVWEALVDPEQIAVYMMGARVETDWKEGSPIVWKGEWKGKPFEDRGKLLAVRQPDLLAYTHVSGVGDSTEHVVKIELKEAAGVTHVRLTQTNNASEQARDESQKNWTTMLDDLKKMLGEAPVAQPEQPRT